MRDYRSTSFWLETCGDDLTPRAALKQSVDCDVAILGAGYSGLWTAYYLLKADPKLRVVIVEREIAGFGASGRNGGWCSAGLNISLHRLEKLHGRDAARATYQAMFDTLDEIERVVRDERLDVDWRRGGQLLVARGTHQVPALRETFDEFDAYGFGDRYQLLDAGATAERVRIDGALGGLYTPDCAVVQPATLARKLARLVERMGATIVEGTEVTDYRPRAAGRRPALMTPNGDVTADVVVLAGEAYLTRLRRLHRQLVPLYSLIVLTEPLSDEHWAQIGWQAHECVASMRLSVDYLSRTADGRILFGGRGAPYRFGSPIRDDYDRHDPTHEMLRGMARSWFPVLRDVEFTHAWGGPLGMPRDWHPTFSLDRRSGVATARGYVGHGVATTNLAGRTLADLIGGRETAVTRLPFVGHGSRNWEPEPFRWIGVRFAQEALGRVDAKAARTGRPPTGRSLAERIARH
ncbi:MAG TPA: FAD-binding oxidoreductase [Candidatus Limnocylindrales bacterium]|nr:FAD-binding oxidoreductase [Candidatus Limnocylindrales bacterium]